MFYKETYAPRIPDCGRDGKMSYEAIFQLLETVGGHHADMVHDSLLLGSLRGVAWIVANWRVSLRRRIDGTEKLYVTTWMHGRPEAFTSTRNYIVTDDDGAEVIFAEAKMCLVDTSSGKLTRIGKALHDAYASEEKTVFETHGPRLCAPASYMSEHEIYLRRGDIDFNHHVHNTRYVAFALEALPQDVYESGDFAELFVVYLKPMTEGARVTARYTHTETGHFVGIYADETLCAMIELRDR